MWLISKGNTGQECFLIERDNLVPCMEAMTITFANATDISRSLSDSSLCKGLRMPLQLRCITNVTKFLYML